MKFQQKKSTELLSISNLHLMNTDEGILSVFTFQEYNLL